MARKIFIALFFLFSCVCLNAVAIVEETATHNTGLASTLLGAQNACNIPERQPTEGDIFSVAQIKAVTIIPLVDGITSDRAEPKLLWSWSAKYPNAATFALSSYGSCPAGEIKYYKPRELHYNGGKLTFTYGNTTTDKTISKNGPNPIELALNSNALGENDFAQVYTNLSVHLETEISVMYDYTKTEHYTVCYHVQGDKGGGDVCYCNTKITLGNTTFRKKLTDNKNFLVENGPVEDLWLNPPLQKRLNGQEKSKLAFFARRMPANISITEDGKQVAFVEPYMFETKQGECGAVEVTKNFSPSGKNFFLNKSDDGITPTSLVEKNRSYIPFYMEFEWNATPGKKQTKIYFEDMFSDTENFSREFSVREPVSFLPDGNLNGSNVAMEIRKGSEDKTPAAYPVNRHEEIYFNFSALAVLFTVPFVFLAWAIMRKIRG